MRRLDSALLILRGAAFALSTKVPGDAQAGSAVDLTVDTVGATESVTSKDTQPAVLVPSGEKFHDVAEIVLRLSRRSPVKSIAFAPDGRSVASGSDDGTIQLWDLASGKELRRLEGHAGTVYSVAFAPDGRHLAWALMTRPSGCGMWLAARSLRSLAGRN
jgi:WD40 repeat protein